MSIAGLSTGKLVSKFKRELRSSQVKSSHLNGPKSRCPQLEKLNLKALFPGIIRALPWLRNLEGAAPRTR